MMGHYLRLVLSDTEITMNQLARFWSARAATLTTCVAAIGLLFFVVGTQSQVSLTTYGWALFWTTVLVGSILLFREQRDQNSAWKSSAWIAGLFGLMVMHHLLPAYSRHQTLLGDGSPIFHEFTSTDHVATLSYEFSEVPFYLNRTDMPHWRNADSRGLTEFLKSRPESILVINRTISVDQLRKQLPADASTTLIADRGPARIVRVLMNSNDAKLAMQAGDAESISTR